MSCTRQLDARDLLNKPDDVTRSTVQKSVVIVAKSPHVFTAWREKLSLVTRAWFMQRKFTNTTILKEFQENLEEGENNTSDEERDHFVGISLREFIHEFKHQALVLFKCCLLQPKMLFFGSKCEKLCMMQFALVSLIPGLIRKLEDCADPELDNYEKTLVAPTSLKTSDRTSLLAYVGLPIQIFGKGSLFGPYTPLQQLDVLADFGTKSYIVGSTNSLLLQQKDRYSDIIVNLDDSTISITSTSLRTALSLTAADRRWIDMIYQEIVSSWDPANPARPSHLGFKGSEDYIRILFEQYTIALLSATKFHLYLTSVPAHKRSLSAFSDLEADPSLDFSEPWLDAWKTTSSFALWNRLTDAHLFDLVDPRHPTAGGFSIDDFNRRFAQQFHDLQLDERFASSREVLGKSLASGQKKVSAAINTMWADFEARRAARARTHGDALSPPPTGLQLSPATSAASSPAPSPASASFLDSARSRAPDFSAAQAAASAAGQKAGAYFSSWGSWAAERRKGWGAKAILAENLPARPASVPVGGAFGKLPAEGGMKEKGESEINGSVGAAGEVESEKRRSVGSPRKGVRRGASKESVGSDGIGRLDA